ncbi:MAG TPA: Ig-like domain-containing protein [Vicinamibacterales bacterium]|nr:Ig-like domain-containing protein [Vicinamibacterales bacterium]
MGTRGWTGRLLTAFITTALIALSAARANAQSFTYCGPADIAFVVDNTTYMLAAINDLKASLGAASAILTQIEQSCNAESGAGPDYRLALVTFTDTVQVRLNFSPNNRSQFQAAIAALTTGSAGAGIANASDEALNTVINALPASARPAGKQTGDFTEVFRDTINGNVHVRKFIILLTSSPPGGFDGDYTEPLDLDNAHVRAMEAAAKGIRILAILPPLPPGVPAGGNAQGAMLDFADVTGGYFTRTDEPSPPFPLGLTYPSVIIKRYLSDPDPLFKGSCTRVNRPPIAVCGSTLEMTAVPSCNPVHASVDAGSYDMEDDVFLSIVQSPPGPYAAGTTTDVTLTINDVNGASASCQGTVDVLCGTDTQNPGVVLEDPSWQQITGLLPLTAFVTDETSTKVDFFANGVLIGSDNTPLYMAFWNTNALPSGRVVELTARGTDAAGHIGDAVRVIVSVDHTDTTPPTVTLWAPTPPVTGIETVSASAKDYRGIAQVQFFAGATSLGIDTSEPYEATWDTTQLNDGSQVVLKAVATDLTGLTSESTITVLVDHTDRTRPVVAFTAPPPGSVTGVVELGATASDANGVTQVSFYLGGVTLIGSDTAVPYTVLWDTRPLADGPYTLVARAYDAANNYSDATIDVTVTHGVPVVITSMTPSVTFPVPVSTPIMWTATATGGAPPLEYQFWQYHFASAAWTMVRDYALDPSVTWWTPASSGVYVFEVRVRSTSSPTTAYEASFTSGTFLIGAPATFTSLTPSASSAPYGTEVTWTAAATGGASPLEYEFWRYCYANPGWTKVQDYSTTNTFTWTPAPSDIGLCYVHARVRSVGLTVRYEGYIDSAGFQVLCADPPMLKSVTPSPASPVQAPATITWTALATGGTGPLEYEFWRYSYTTRIWSRVQNYSTSNTYTWPATIGDAGQYALHVRVRCSSSWHTPPPPFEDYLDTSPFTITSSAPARITAVSVTPSSPQPYGKAITWTATGAGGTGTLLYEFWRYCTANPGWIKVQAYGSVGGASYTWTPQANDVGSCYIHVRVKSVTSTQPFEGYFDTPGFRITSAVPVTLASLTASPQVPVQGGIGTTITWTATASPAGAYQYQFWRYSKTSGLWTMVRDYAASNTFVWAPSLAEAGIYAIEARVRTIGSTAMFESYLTTRQFAITPTPPPVVSSLTASPGSPRTQGTAITLTASATGGSGTLEYEFWDRNLTAGTWTLIRAYGATNAATWTATGVGTHQFQVNVRSAVNAWMPFESYAMSANFVVQ